MSVSKEDMGFAKLHRFFTPRMKASEEIFPSLGMENWALDLAEAFSSQESGYISTYCAAHEQQLMSFFLSIASTDLIVVTRKFGIDHKQPGTPFASDALAEVALTALSRGVAMNVVIRRRENELASEEVATHAWFKLALENGFQSVDDADQIRRDASPPGSLTLHVADLAADSKFFSVVDAQHCRVRVDSVVTNAEQRVARRMGEAFLNAEEKCHELKTEGLNIIAGATPVLRVQSPTPTNA